MALSLQDENLVWQKVNQALQTQLQPGSTGGAQTGASPASQNAFRALKLQMATQKRNPQLQFIAFGKSDVDAATGDLLTLGAHTLYAVYARKLGTGTTQGYLAYFDANTNTGATAQNSPVLAFKSQYDESFAMSPTGWKQTNATGPVIASVTTPNGGTATTGDSDSQSGFIIVGA